MFGVIEKNKECKLIGSGKKEDPWRPDIKLPVGYGYVVKQVDLKRGVIVVDIFKVK